MKTISIILISIASAFQLVAQYSSLGKIDTVTTGDYNDVNPVLVHGIVYGGFSSSYQWLIFERNRDINSEIVGKKFLTKDASWDSAEVIISSSFIPLSQRNPDISGTSYPSNNFSQLAAWERKENDVWNIFYSRFMDNDSTWMPPQPLTQDNVDNTNVQIRQLSDSSFIAVWKRKSILLYSIVNSATASIPETLAVSASDSLEFDIISQYSSGNLVWTSRDTTDKNIMILRSYDNYPIFSITVPETLFYSQSAFNPRFTLTSYGDKSIFFEISINGNREVMMWKEFYPQSQNIENISNDSLADDRNPRAFSSPVITKRGFSSKGSYSFPYGIFTMEKYTSTDSTLIFSISDYFADTIKNAGYNRKVIIGSKMFNDNGDLSVVTVWESNRSGHSHVYSRLIRFPMGGIKPPELFPRSFRLEQNYPNPFNPITNIKFTIVYPVFVSLKIFDLLGREVTTIVDENLMPGRYERPWDASKFASGIYFYRLAVGTYSETKKLLLIK